MLWSVWPCQYMQHNFKHLLSTYLAVHYINRSAPPVVQMFPFPQLLWASSNLNHAIFAWVCLHGQPACRRWSWAFRVCYFQALTTPIHAPVSWVKSTACSTVSQAHQSQHEGTYITYITILDQLRIAAYTVSGWNRHWSSTFQRSLGSFSDKVFVCVSRGKESWCQFQTYFTGQPYLVLKSSLALSMHATSFQPLTCL